MLKKPELVTRNGQSRDIRNIGNDTENEDKQNEKHNTEN